MKTNKLNKMKKAILIVLIALVPMISFSQSVFEKYEDMDDVSTVVVTKHAFKLLSKIESDSQEVQEYKKMITSLDNLTVYTTENESIAAKMKAEVRSFLKSSKMSELIRVKDKDANVKIFVREGNDKDHISELFMFVYNLKTNVKVDGRSPKAVIVSLTGNIDLNDISKITKKFNIPGGEHLNKAHH